MHGNPALNERFIRKGGRTTRADILTPTEQEEFQNALKEISNKDYYYIWRIGVTTGLRVSDILNFDSGLNTNKPYVHEIKTGKRKRIYLQKDIVSYINEKKKNLKPNEKIFNISRQIVWRTFKATAQKAGIKKNIGTHTMRRTFAKSYVQKNGIYKLKKALNHECLSDTVFYTIPNEEFTGTSTTKERRRNANE